MTLSLLLALLAFGVGCFVGEALSRKAVRAAMERLIPGLVETTVARILDIARARKRGKP